MRQVDASMVKYLSRKYGPILLLPDGMDGAALMLAIAGRESSFGFNCKPRHEPAYDAGGAYQHNPEQAALLARYGSAAACSYGPWQVMLVNCQGMTPIDLEDPEQAARAFVGHVNKNILVHLKAETVEQIAQAYNSGNFSHPPSGVVLDYIEAVRKYYDAFVNAQVAQVSAGSASA